MTSQRIHACRVYHTSGIKVNSKSRSEHLEFESTEELSKHLNPNNITQVEYFNAVGVKELKEHGTGAQNDGFKAREFKANLWMSEEFPSSAKEQLSPCCN